MYIAYVIIFIFVIYKYATRNFNYWKNKGVPYIKPTPFVGTSAKMLFFQTSIGEHIKELYFQTKEPYVGFFVGDQPYLLLRSPEIIKLVLIKDFNHFSDRTVARNLEKDPLGSHILFCEVNPTWKQIRPKVSPLFTSGKIKQMFFLMMEVATDLQNYMKNVLHREVDAKWLCQKFTVDVIASCVFGLKSSSLEKESSDFNEFAKRVFDFNWKRGLQMTCSFIMPSIFKLSDMTFLDSEAAGFFEKIFPEAVKRREESKCERNDLIDIIIKLKNETVKDGAYGLDLKTIIAQATQFFIAGFETASSTISFALYELCYNQETQNNLRKEILETIEIDGGLSYGNVHSMKYLMLVVRETLRMYPILPFLDRECTMNYEIPNTGIIIEKGTRIHVPLLGLHYDPDYFQEPDKFIPERFLPENINWPNEVYLPFGEGPRNCIGKRFGYLNVLTGLAFIISKYKVKPSENTPKKIKFNSKGFLLASEEGLPMIFEAV